MEDPKLNRIIEETRELHTRWGQFHEFFKMALKAERISPEAEAKFLDLKTRIAMLHDGFMQALHNDQKVGQGVLSIISSCIMLRRIPLMSTAESQKLELDWNEIYLLMTETIANLEDERERLSTVNATTYKIQQFKMKVRGKIASILQSGPFQLCVILFFIGFVIFGIPMLGIYDYTQLRTDVPILAPVVNKMISWARVMGAEMPYDIIEDIPAKAVDTTGPFRDVSEKAVDRAKASREFVISQLFQYGFADTDIQKAKSLIEGAKQWRADGFLNAATNQGMVAYLILMPTSGDAEKLISLRSSGLTKRSKGDQDNIATTINVCRVSNLVILAISESKDLREDYLKEKYSLSEAQMRLK